MERRFLGMSVAAAVLCGLAVSGGATAHSDTITVCWDGSGDYLTIQEGIDAASDGDEVVVCDGTYTGEGNKNLDFNGKAITVRSENGPDACIVHCEGDGRAFHFYNAETQASVVDGFRLTNGHAWMGGAVYCDESSPTITNCTITGNIATSCGGGVQCESLSHPTLTNCTITGNTAEQNHGGGVFCAGESAPTLIDCTITGNTAGDDGGALCCYKDGNPTLTNCTISSNWAKTHGGGVYCRESSVTFINCTIAGNRAGAGDGGGVYCLLQSTLESLNCRFLANMSRDGGAVFLTSGSDASITGCIFAANRATDNGGGIWSGDDSHPSITSSTFTGNHAYSSGGGIACGGNSTPMITNCTFSGNRAQSGGGAISTDYEDHPIIINCVFSGNVADDDGGAIACCGGDLAVTNCAFSANSAGDLGGAIACFTGDDVITNCVLWGDTPDEIHASGAGNPVVTYSNVKESWPGEGNIDADPLFVGGPSGYWTTYGAYDWVTCQITFRDDEAAWAVNQLIGKLVNPDTTQTLQFVIVANTGATITVWADWATIEAGASWVTAGASYGIHDYDLDPLGGSPCVDAANNDAVPAEVETDIAGRPRFVDDPETPDTGHGDPPIVDMGAYEYQGWVLGDLNCDGVLDFEDINPFVLALTNPAQYEAVYPYCSILRADINGDGEVDFGDINPFVALLIGC